MLFLAPTAADPGVRQLCARLAQRRASAGEPRAAGAIPSATIVVTRGPLEHVYRADRPEASTLGGVPLAAVAGVYVVALPPRVPGLAPGPSRTAAERLTDQQAADARRDAVCAALEHLAQRGAPILNPPVGGTLLQNKLAHLSAAAALGLAVPPTVVGDKDAAAALLAAGPAVDKPARAWSPTIDAVNPLRPGLMRQARVDGAPTRVMLLDGKIIGAAAVEGTTAIDHRMDPAFTSGRAHYRPVEVPSEVRVALVTLAAQVGLRWAGADFMVDDGRWVFLELNAAPVWVEQAERTGVDVAAALLDVLVGRPSAH